MTPLLHHAAAAPVFAPLAGKRVGLVHSPATGNAGDRLIEAAAEQLLAAFGVAFRVVEPDDAGARGADVLLLFGGGNYGHERCPVEADRRRRALATGRPCVLLPQTAYGVEPGRYRAAFVRDVPSLAFVPHARLAPDLSLFYRPTRPAPAPRHRVGEFFTTSWEGYWPGRGEDPRHRFTDPEDYLLHVADHEAVITDCLHAAIGGLIAGRRVTLLPTRLHKQRGAWEAYLRHLGCAWADAA